ncbi:MAG: HAMP domain-containing sensor histidine kinase [Pseudomonadota bacterium]
MSSATNPSLLRSSSLRLSVLLMLVIWGVSAGIIVAVVGASERTLLRPLNDEITGQIEFFVEQLQGDEVEIFDWYEEELEAAFINTEDIDEEDLAAFLDVYVDRLESDDEGSDRRQAAIQARLFLLTGQGGLESVDRPLDYYLLLLFEETPEDFHGDLYDSIESRLDDWPSAWHWERMTVAARIDVLVAALSRRAHDEEFCLRLSPTDPADNWKSYGLSSGDFQAVRLEVETLLGVEERLCWVRELPIGGTRVLQYGRYADATLLAVSTNRSWRNIGVLISLSVSILLGSLLGRRIYGRLRTVNALTEQVRRGDLEHRLRLTGSGDDFDQLSANINAMLDKIVTLMSGVRQVSDNIAHDLRTPLTRLRNRIEHLQTIDQPTADDIAPIAEQADEVLATFSSLLRIAQLEQGSQRQSFAPVDLCELLSEVVDLYEPVFADAGIQLLLDLQRERVVTTGDAQLWVQVFNNLLENCLRYAAESISVTVVITATRGHAIVTVHDQGPGVPDHTISRLTERFFRGDEHRNAGGTGLGLALVAAIGRIHGATVDFANDSGLKVTLRIPLA